MTSPNPTRFDLRRSASVARLAVLLMIVSAAFLACGDAEEPGVSAPAPQASALATGQQQHLQDLRQQMDSLERQSEAVRREMLSRLDQIDVARDALANQIAGLEAELGAPAGVPAPPATADAHAPGAPAAPVAPAVVAQTEAPSPDAADDSPFLRFVLLIFILGAIFFLGRIFFERWGDGEDGERPAPVETTTDLGKIRFPPGTEVRSDDDDHGATEDDEDGGRPGD